MSGRARSPSAHLPARGAARPDAQGAGAPRSRRRFAAPRAASRALVAALVALLSGCATIVIGPREATNPIAFLTEPLVDQRPVELYQGPSSGLGATYQETLYRALESASAATTLSPEKWELVYVHGWGRAGSGAPAGHRRPPRPGAARPAVPREPGWPPVPRAVERLVANELADLLLRLRVPVTDDPRAASLWLLPRVLLAGGSTTERVYRFYQYPIYYHYEDHRQSAVSVLLYDRRKNKVVDLSSVRARRLAVDSYILDIFGIRFEL